MQKEIIKYSFLLVMLYLTLFSCIKEVDFDQAEDFQISPVIESSLIFFDEPASSFSINNTEIPPIEDFIEIELFDNDFVVDNLIKAEFIFETTNSINKGFQVKVDLIDDAEQHLYTFTMSASPSLDGSNVLSFYREVFEDDKLVTLKNTTKLIFTLSLLPGGVVNQTDLGRIKLESKAIFYLNIGDSI